jgi:hypothetical protein
MQFVIDNGMRSGIPDRETRAATVTLYTDVAAFMRALGVESTRDIAVLVVTPTGEILARVSGRYSEKTAAPIERALVAPHRRASGLPLHPRLSNHEQR